MREPEPALVSLRTGLCTTNAGVRTRPRALANGAVVDCSPSIVAVLTQGTRPIVVEVAEPGTSRYPPRKARSSNHLKIGLSRFSILRRNLGVRFRLLFRFIVESPVKTSLTSASGSRLELGQRRGPNHARPDRSAFRTESPTGPHAGTRVPYTFFQTATPNPSPNAPDAQAGGAARGERPPCTGKLQDHRATARNHAIRTRLNGRVPL